VSEVLIVGGGLAGAAAAAALGREKVPVRVLEREKGPCEKICGEFLSIEAQAHLAALGIDAADLGASSISHVRLVCGKRSAEARLPFVALGLSRRRLDEALLAKAQSLGAQIERGVAVRQRDGGLETSRGALEGGRILLASGKHDVRGARRDAAAVRLSGMLGFKSHFRLAARQAQALEGFVEIILLRGGYAGLQMVEDGRANLCLVVRRAVFDTAGRTWTGLFDRLMGEPHLNERLSEGEQLFSRPLTIADIPYGFTHHRKGEASGLYRLGDQSAVIPSFCGNGMAIALHSARLAANAVLAGADAGAYHARLRRDVGGQIRLAAWLQQRTETWPGGPMSVGLLSLAPGLIARLVDWTRLSSAVLAEAGTQACTNSISGRPRTARR